MHTFNRILDYQGFITSPPVIPKFYWDTYSQEQRIKHICKELHRLCEYANALNVNININRDDIDVLEKEFEEFKESGFFDYYADQLENWINENMECILKKSMQMVFFGLTDGGYFAAYIPDSWDDIIFDTGAVYELDTYGRLILRYDVDKTNRVTQ